jgi:hypothetical protein
MSYMTLFATLAAALAAASPQPLELVATTSKPVYAPGEEVVVSISLRNVGKTPVIVAKARSPIYPSAGITARLLDPNGKPLEASSNLHEGQWAGGHQVGPDAFARIEPGASVEVSEERFKIVWTERRPERKDEFDKLPKEFLAPGTYKTAYTYTWEHRLVKDTKGRWVDRLEIEHAKKEPGYNASLYGMRTFKPGVFELYKAAVPAKLTAAATFEVRP